MSDEGGWLSEYPDLVATSITIVTFIIIGVGAKVSVSFNSVFTILNSIVLLFIIVAGFCFARPSLWSTDGGYGGFFPFGFSGTVSGAATCFYAYIGFEGIAVASEEARDPEKSVPRATVLSMFTVTCLYLLACASLTLMVPYVHTNTSACSRSKLGSQRITDCDVVEENQAPIAQTPIYSVIVFGSLAALLALLFEISTLVEFMSIGTLFGYTIVSASIIILRYQPVNKCQFKVCAQSP
ncbi:cationic amino acid transporter 4 [Elysia marginata]|uniref:Cationic amino acid transporter 4 n=1 Tax=Elysia marginata TaxID=1093978 RepID=A0AAV4FX32_9GAST|nr:cationic amino acid transporter 4 [Elysia marginata]